MERTVLKYSPSYWDTCLEDNEQFKVGSSSEEFRIIAYQTKQATRNSNLHIKKILRNQNIHDFGQLLIREQLMAVLRSYEKYYRVRRFITIKKQFLTNALQYNLDHRRCGKSSLIFGKYLTYVGDDDVVLVVQVLTNSPNSDCIAPANSSDYFIDYIVYL
ncbi:uncharacterized protein LOC108913053 [Anoplophora glabripennis]|uniref:uncharacterized protein LOC108913053 n=1 Tax=Anoplophora glabripennis TaxID=217634 RepID=UPI000873CDF4|nr:uncharacterized protein LOC108913053 [Anoplophora glabripennis]